MIRALACTLALLFAAGTAPAQHKQVFRCETGGKITYADAPCKGGAEVATDPNPSEVQRKAARDAVLREEQMAEKMARERHAAEAAAGRQRAAHIPYSAAEKAASAPAKPDGKKKKAKKKPAAAPQS